MKNVYIAGIVKGNFRTQNLVKYLLDYDIRLYYNSFYNEKEVNFNCFNLFYFIYSRFIYNIFKHLNAFFLIPISDLIIIPAMCNDFQFELLFAKLWKKKIITDYYISFYDTLVLDRRIFPIGSKQAKKRFLYDLRVIKYSDYVLFLNKIEAERYLRLVNKTYDPHKHLIVPLIVETDSQGSLPYFNQDIEKKKNFKFNICWWGTYIPLHGLENIIQACFFLKKENNINFHLNIFGSNDHDSLPYHEIVNNLKLNDVVSIKNDFSMKKGNLSLFLKQNCDLVLGNFGSSEKSKNVIINKVIEGISMRIPILTGVSHAHSEYFSEKMIFYSENNPIEIAKNIEKIMLTSKDEILERVESSYKVYLDNFSLNSYRNNMSLVLAKLDIIN